MKVLHLWKSDYLAGGGGAIAMYRLHAKLREKGIDSNILCEDKTTESPHVFVIKNWRFVESFLRPLASRTGLSDIQRLSSFRISKHEAFSNTDILHFHGIHSGFINYLALPSLTRSKPAIFTLHDMWCMTGICTYSYDCERWKIGCGKCPYPDANRAIRRDTSRFQWRLKDWTYSRSNLTIVAVSNWLKQLAKQSMLKRFLIYDIPNGIDIEAYQPLNPEQCRKLLGIPPGKKVLMFAAKSLKNPRKGKDLLIEGLQKLPKSLKTETILLTIGNESGSTIEETLGINTLNLGYITNDRLKAIAYSAADLFVLPTRLDNLPLVLQESMACGTPMVSFRVGGVPELVRPGITGYLAEPENANDLCNGIVHLLEDESLRNYMSEQCRAIVLKEYTLELQANRFTELYRELLQN